MPTFKETAIAKFIVTARERIKNLQNRTDAMYNQLDKDWWITQKFYDRWQIDILKEMMPMLEETIKSIPEPNKYEIAEWISVEERLPDVWSFCLWVWSNSSYQLWKFGYTEDWFPIVDIWGSIYWVHNLPYWQPLPKPPEEKSSNK